MKGKTKQFLVLGLGRFGDSIARNLYSLGHEVMAVDRSVEHVDAIAPYVTQAVQADATDEAALEALGVRNFDVAIISIGSNIRDSILVSVICKELGVPFIVAKAVDELHAKVLRKVGVDRVVFPEREMGQRVAKSLVTPNILELMELTNDYQLVEIVCPDDWGGKTLLELDVRRTTGLSVIAVHRGEQFMVSPGADVALKEGDVLLVLGQQKSIDAIERKK